MALALSASVSVNKAGNALRLFQWDSGVEVCFFRREVAMKKAVSNIPGTLSSTARSRVIDFPETSESGRSEQAIENRLRELTALVADLADSGYGYLLSEEPATQEAFDELRVKEAALRWIVRVARHSSGDVREKLWSDIEDAVTSLEKSAELLLHCDLIWPHTFSSNQEGQQAGRGRF
jgi:hypothetical protein